jgi:hypothetical protein
MQGRRRTLATTTAVSALQLELRTVEGLAIGNAPITELRTRSIQKVIGRIQHLNWSLRPSVG